MRSLRDLDLGALWQQHPGGNLQSPPSWVHDTDRPISPLRTAKDLQGSTTKRVKGVEDLNIRITRTQGIVGVGATIRTPISSSRRRLLARPPALDYPAGPGSFCRCGCPHASSAACSSRTDRCVPSRAAALLHRPRRPRRAGSLPSTPRRVHHGIRKPLLCAPADLRN